MTNGLVRATTAETQEQPTQGCSGAADVGCRDKTKFEKFQQYLVVVIDINHDQAGKKIFSV